MKNYAMWISYDGTRYAGWQRQKNHMTVQGIIEKELSFLLKRPITIHASGRTDAGVHALEQCASFEAALPMPTERLKQALSNALPDDMALLELINVSHDFHARYSAIGKTYEYRLYCSKATNPFLNRYATQCKYVLDEKSIREAMGHFLGEHDFIGFMASGSHVKDTVRTIHSFDLEIVDNLWTFRISGDGFLYNMVRIIIGLMMRVGQGFVRPEDVLSIIESKNRSAARWTAPPQGLFLKTIFYPQNEIKNLDNC